MKRIVLTLLSITLFCGMAFGQLPKKAEKPTLTPANPPTTSANPSLTPANPTTPSNGTEKRNPSNSLTLANPKPSKKAKQTSVSQNEAHAISGLLLGYNFKKKPSHFVFQYDFGSKSAGPMFWTLGLGFNRGKSSYTLSGKEHKTIAWSLRVPAYMGVLFGEEDGLNLSVKAGVMYNYIMSSKTDNKPNSWSGIDRSSFGGSVKFTIFHIFAEYDFPFKSIGDGAWLFGLCWPF